MSLRLFYASSNSVSEANKERKERRSQQRMVRKLGQCTINGDNVHEYAGLMVMG